MRSLWQRVPHKLGHEPFFPFGIIGDRGLTQEVFFLAYYLHWSREDILGLAIPERRRYLELLEEQLKREVQTSNGGN